jgi:hypothetical protein
MKAICVSDQVGFWEVWEFGSFEGLPFHRIGNDKRPWHISCDETPLLRKRDAMPTFHY